MRKLWIIFICLLVVAKELPYYLSGIAGMQPCILPYSTGNV